MQLNRLLDESPPLLEMYLLHLMNKYDFISLDETNPNQRIKINHAPLFNFLMGKPLPHFNMPIPPSMINEAQDFAFNNTKEIKVILAAVIIYKKNLLKKRQDLFLTRLNLNHLKLEKSLNKNQTHYTPIYLELMNQSVNDLFLEANI